MKDDKNINKWYKLIDDPNCLIYLTRLDSGELCYGYGFNRTGTWYDLDSLEDLDWGYIDDFELVDNDLVEKRLLEYAKEKYPIGTEYKHILEYNNNYKVIGQLKAYCRLDNEDQVSYITDSNGGSVYDNGKWAEIISTPKEAPEKYEYGELLVGINGGDLWFWIQGKGRGENEGLCSFYAKDKQLSNYPGFMGPMKDTHKATPSDIQKLNDLGYEVKDLKFVKIEEPKRKFGLGIIGFKGKKSGDLISNYFIEYNSDIPSHLIIHGDTRPHNDYDTQGAKIIDFYKNFYIVNFKSFDGHQIQLGFKEESLEEFKSKNNVESKQLESFPSTDKIDTKTFFKKGDYVKYKGTKSNGTPSWKKYFGCYGVKSGDVGVISECYSDKSIHVKDSIRDHSNGRLTHEDLELISKEEYDRYIKIKDDKSDEIQFNFYVKCIGSENYDFKVGNKYKASRIKNDNKRFILNDSDENGYKEKRSLLYSGSLWKFEKVTDSPRMESNTQNNMIDKNCYTKVNSEKEWLEVMHYLRSIGESIDKGYTFTDSWNNIVFDKLNNGKWGLAMNSEVAYRTQIPLHKFIKSDFIKQVEPHKGTLDSCLPPPEVNSIPKVKLSDPVKVKTQSVPIIKY